MFDIGFSELMILAVVALVVVGPERLPKVARTVGHLMGRFQRYVSDVKSDIDRELRLDEMKKLREEVESQARKIESQASSEANRLESDLARPAQEISGLVQQSAGSMPSIDAPPDKPASEATPENLPETVAGAGNKP